MPWVFGAWLSMCVTPGTADAQLTNRTILHEFGFPRLAGYGPVGRLLEGSDGWLYGVTAAGSLLGDYGGVVYKMRRDGSGYTTLRHCGPLNIDGHVPQGGLLEARNGVLYGTTKSDEGGGWSTLFRLNKDGSDARVIHRFSRSTKTNCVGVLTEGRDGILYGKVNVARLYDDDYDTRLFRINPDGTGFELWLFPENANGVIEGIDGMLYGTARYGGSANHGFVFRMSKQGTGLQVLHDFLPSAPTDGAIPEEGVIEGSDGWLYGTTVAGGAFHSGVLFRLRKDGSGFEVLHSFVYEGISQIPWGGLTEDAAGVLHGLLADHARTTGTQFRINRDGTGFVTVRQFNIPRVDSWPPPDPFLITRDGMLYGSSRPGGSRTNRVYFGLGTVFRVESGDSREILWDFRDYRNDDGINPAALVEASDGYLYFTTEADFYSYYWGRLGKCSRDGSSYSVLRNFQERRGEPNWGGRSLIEGSDGLLYGINRNWDDYRDVFRIAKDGSGQTLLHQFEGGDSHGVIEASDGWLYGTAHVLYRIDKATGQYEVLRDLGAIAGQPVAGGPVPVEGTDGRLYGTTLYGSTPADASGTVFGVNKNGSGYDELHRFGVITNDGSTAYGSLIEARDGRLYGTTYGGGVSNRGTIFGLDKNGSNYVILHHFTGTNGDGRSPLQGLVEGRDGALYGTTQLGGTVAGGTIFKLNKDGSEYRVLVQNGVPRKLISGRDGALYGLGSTEAMIDFGVIFRYGHALGLERTTNETHLKLTGIPGYTYELQRSADLTHWITLRTNTMPDSLLVSHQDTNATTAVAFYRVRVP